MFPSFKKNYATPLIIITERVSNTVEKTKRKQERVQLQLVLHTAIQFDFFLCVKWKEKGRSIRCCASAYICSNKKKPWGYDVHIVILLIRSDACLLLHYSAVHIAWWQCGTLDDSFFSFLYTALLVPLFLVLCEPWQVKIKI